MVVTYKKLPEGNDDFGSKTITASIPDMELSDSKDFRVFFERDGTDHPDSGGNEKRKLVLLLEAGAGAQA